MREETNTIMDNLTMELSGKRYELKYSLGRMERIEQAMKRPIAAALQAGGLLSIQDLKIAIGMAMKEEDANAYVAPQKGLDLAEQLLEQEGYAKAIQTVLLAMQRDCPFFFQAD